MGGWFSIRATISDHEGVFGKGYKIRGWATALPVSKWDVHWVESVWLSTLVLESEQ